MVQNQCATTARRKLIFTALEPNYKVRKQNETMQHDTYELYMRRGWIPCDFSTVKIYRITRKSNNWLASLFRYHEINRSISPVKRSSKIASFTKLPWWVPNCIYGHIQISYCWLHRLLNWICVPKTWLFIVTWLFIYSGCQYTLSNLNKQLNLINMIVY